MPKGKNNKVIWLMRDEVGGKIMTTFVALRTKIYSYLTDDSKQCEKAKCIRKCVIKRKLKS